MCCVVAGMSGDGERTPTAGAEDDEDEEDDFDLVSQINYNTITSLAALKEILGHDSRTSTEDVSWFQHYFLHHVNRLPSRSQYPGRRLSECPEEDETAANKDDSSSSSSASSSSSSSGSSADSEEESKEESKAESKEDVSPVGSASATPKRNPSLTPDTPPMSPRRGTSPHLDKRFFDSSMIEMKSQASSSSTLDNDSAEEIWVRRIDLETSRRKRVSVQAFDTIV